jgi:hypothetical protein
VTINQSNTTAQPSERILQNLKQLSTSVSSIKDIFSKIGTQQQTASTLLSEDGPFLSPQETLNTNRPTRQPGAPELPNAYEEPSPNIFFTSNRPNEIAPLPEDPTDPEEANREKTRAYGSGKRELVLTLSPSLHQSFYIGARDPPTNQENARAGPPQEAIKENPQPNPKPKPNPTTIKITKTDWMVPSLQRPGIHSLKTSKTKTLKIPKTELKNTN